MEKIVVKKIGKKSGFWRMRITKEELVQIVKEEIHNTISEKTKRQKKKDKKKAKADDRCTRIAKRKYDVWPSAYASGAVVKCRQGKIWKGVNENDDVSLNEEYEDILKKEVHDALSEMLAEKKDNFKSHRMYCPKSGRSQLVKTKEDHLKYKKKGFVHFDPDDLRDVLEDEGGAAGLEPLVKAVKADEEEVKRALKMMPDVGKHKEGDYILDDGRQVDIKESVLRTLAEKKNLKNGQNPKDQKE